MTDAVASVVAGHDGLLPLQQRLLVALFSAMTEHTVTARGPPAPDGAEATASFARRDLQFRSRMVQTMLLCALVRRPIPEDVVARDRRRGGRARCSRRHGRRGPGIRGRVAGVGGGGLLAQRVRRRVERRGGGGCGARLAPARLGLGLLRGRRGDGGAVAVARAPRAGHARPQGVGDVPGPRLCLPGYAGLGSADAHPARLGARPGRLRHDGRIGGRGVRVHRPGQRRPARLLAPGHGHLALRDGVPRDGRRALRALRGPLLVQPAHGGAPGRCHVPGRRVPRHRGRSGQRRLPHDGLVRHRAPQLRRPAGQVQSGAEVGGGASRPGPVGPWEPGGISPFQLAAGQALAAARGVPYDAHGASA